MRLPRILLAAALVAAALGGCSEDRRSPGPESLEQVDVSPVATVEIDSEGFEPSSISIRADEVFELTNTGDAEHSLRIEDPFLDTGDLRPGESTRVSMRTAGTHVAVDGADPENTLEITVSAAG